MLTATGSLRDSGEVLPAYDVPVEVAVHCPIDDEPYPIRLVNWFMSK
jgi:hypothetical protein